MLIYLIALAALLQCFQCARVSAPDPIILRELIDPSHYEIISGELLTLMYEAYPGVYSSELFELTNTTSGKKVQTKVAIEEDRNNYGCNAKQRTLTANKLMELGDLQSGFPQLLYDEKRDLQRASFMDFIIIQKLKRLYIIRDDLQLIEASIELDPQDVNKSSITVTRVVSLLKYFYPNTNVLSINTKEPLAADDYQIVCTDTFYCYVFTSTQVVYFFANSEELVFSEQMFYLTTSPMLIKQITYSAKHGVIYIATDRLGVQVYIIQASGKLDLVYTINQKDFKLKDPKVDLSIVDVNTNSDGSLLFALDEDLGLFVFEVITPTKFVVKDYVIEIRRGKAFNFYHQTFFFVATTMQNMDYALEVFIDFETGSYYLNKLYTQDMQLFDIEVHQHWAIFIGLDAHRVVYHSVFRGFMNQYEPQVYFEDPDLIRIQSYKSSSSVEEGSDDYLLGLSNDDIRIFNVKSQNPFVECQFNNYTLRQYRLLMNATQCPSKQYKNDQSQFSQCQIEHTFTIQSSKVYLGQEWYSTILGISIGVISIIFMFFVLCLVCCRRWNKQLAELEFKTKKLKQELKYSEFRDQGNIAGESENV